MTTTQNDAATRWAAAAKLADGVTDDGLHKRRARVLLQMIALVVGSWIVGVVIALFFISDGSGHDTSGSSDVQTQQLIAESIFLGLGFLVGLVGFIWAKRTGHYITRWRAVASPLNRKEKKGVRRQISGNEQPDEEHLGIVVAIARQNRRATLGIAPIYSAIVLFAIAAAVGSNDLLTKLLELVVSLMFVAVAIQLVVLYRRAGRFIDRHSGESE